MNIPSHIKEILRKLMQNGYTAYLVGGCVRDMPMEKVPFDYDITTNARPTDICSVFSDYKQILTGAKHGTVAVSADSEFVEITTYRIDGKYADNRHPESVTFSDRIEDDLSRRDFTVNAIALGTDGTLTDPFSGRSDIQNKLIRCVGEPDIRFSEDGLRILRALRFSSVLCFDIDEETSKSIHKNRGLLNNISKERIQSELYKLICGQNAENVLTEYSDVFSLFLPESALVSRISELPADIPLRLSAILYNADNANEYLSALRVSNAIKNQVLQVLQISNNLPATRAEICRCMGKTGFEVFKKAVEFAHFANGKDVRVILRETDYIRKNRLPCTVKDLAISGSDITSLGISGRETGIVLENLLSSVISGDTENTKDSLLAEAKRLTVSLL